MDSQRFRQIEAIFNRAVELTGPQRDEYLSEACTSDPQLRHEVERWLDADRATTGDTLPPMAARDVMPDQLPGSRIGPYVVQRKIAEGGMGAVYLAERVADDFQQTVAIKFLTTGLATDLAKQRFIGERKILASLNHPNVARLLDGGTTATGVPYLIMEYIDGLPIDQYCRDQSLTTAARLRLFRQVCAAVQYAHQNLVIHRDIKPSNILVTADGEPKLLDFGIAKLTDPDSAEGGALTRADMRVLTPESASPEQITGDPITTATDVYALGLLLYRLLTGKSPYPIASRRPRDVYRAVLETDPERPSTVVASGSETGAGRPDTTATKLGKELRGDLDAIVLTTLRKEPERRYETVRQLSQDIHNYLQQKPVSARRDSTAYLATKFLSRHSAAVAAAGAAAAVVVSLVTFYTLRLAEERDIAQNERDTAEQVTEFMVELFNGANPQRTDAGDISLRSVLDAGRRNLGSGLTAAPQVQTRLQSVLSEAYRVIGDTEASIELAEAALEMDQRLHGPDSPQAATSQARLGGALMAAGRQEEARPLFEQGLAVLEQFSTTYKMELTETRNTYGVLLTAISEDDLAEQVFEEQIALLEREPDFSPRLLAWAFENMADVMGEKSRDVERIGYMQKALAIRQADPSLTDYALAKLRFNLGNAYMNLEELDSALTNFNEAVAMFVRILGEDNVETATAYMARSRAFANLKRVEEAERDVRTGTEVLTRVYGDNHERVGLAHHYLGTLLWRNRGKHTEALAAYARALGVYEKSVGEDHPLKVFTINSMGGIRREQGNYEGAIADLEQGLAWAATSLPADHQQVVYAHQELGLLHRDRGDFAAARRSFDRGLAVARTDGSYLFTLRPMLDNYIAMEVEQGNPDRAAELQSQLEALEAARNKSIDQGGDL